MSNAELAAALENLAELAVVLVRQCDGDASKIDAGLWANFARKAKAVEDYV